MHHEEPMVYLPAEMCGLSVLPAASGQGRRCVRSAAWYAASGRRSIHRTRAERGNEGGVQPYADLLPLQHATCHRGGRPQQPLPGTARLASPSQTGLYRDSENQWGLTPSACSMTDNDTSLPVSLTHNWSSEKDLCSASSHQATKIASEHDLKGTPIWSPYSFEAVTKRRSCDQKPLQNPFVGLKYRTFVQRD